MGMEMEMEPGDDNDDDDCIRNATFCVRFPPIAAATGDASGGHMGVSGRRERLLQLLAHLRCLNLLRDCKSPPRLQQLCGFRQEVGTLPEERAQRCGIKTLGRRGKESDDESSGHEKETIL